MNGGYDEGYRHCPCFWGTAPGTIVKQLAETTGDLSGRKVLDIGCGEGKNAAYLAKLGCHVRAVDISALALKNAKKAWSPTLSIAWEIADVRALTFDRSEYDIIIAYGLFHCLRTVEEVDQTVIKLQGATRPGGYNITCAFNNRFQQLHAHPGLEPCLLSHGQYLSLYSSWTLLHSSDSDLVESHPHNLIEHKHSLTRLLARKHDVNNLP